MTLDLSATGSLVRCPGGNVETGSQQIAAGVKWAALNIGSDPCVSRDPSVWAKVRGDYRKSGLAIGPWMHCRSLQDVVRVIDIGVLWQADFIGVNVEDVKGDGLSLQELGGYLLDFWVNAYGKPVHMPTLPWVQNGQGWQYVAFATLALELFPLEGHGQLYLDGYQRCIDHAFAEGAKKVTLLYSTTSPRAVYPNVAHCLYTADNVTDWSEWKDDVPQLVPKPSAPPTSPEVPMLTVKQFPYTGPLYGPSHAQGPTRNRSSVKGLKRAMIRMRYLDQQLGSETDDFGTELEKAFQVWWREEVGVGQWKGYGRSSWEALRQRKLDVGPNKGTYALDPLAQKYVQADLQVRCYPHPKGALSEICQTEHLTAGLGGYWWAIDFCAPGGTKILAVESGEIYRLSGHDPRGGSNDVIGIFGWSTYWHTPEGYDYFLTHQGARSVTIGQQINVGQVIGTVGHWPDDPPRSHSHLAVRSPKSSADGKRRIREIANAMRVAV